MTHRESTLRPVFFFPLQLAFSSILVLLASPATAAGQIPGEEQIGIFHTITHLHPVAYVILFLVFVLWVLTMVYQGRLSGVGTFLPRWSRRPQGGKDQGEHPSALPSLVVGDRYRARLGPRAKPDKAPEEGEPGGGVLGKPIN